MSALIKDCICVEFIVVIDVLNVTSVFTAGAKRPSESVRCFRKYRSRLSFYLDLVAVDLLESLRMDDFFHDDDFWWRHRLGRRRWSLRAKFTLRVAIPGRPHGDVPSNVSREYDWSFYLKTVLSTFWSKCHSSERTENVSHMHTGKGFINDTQFVFLYDANTWKHPLFPYWKYERFDLDELTKNQSKANDLFKFAECLQLPDESGIYNSLVAGWIPAIYLNRLSSKSLTSFPTNKKASCLLLRNSSRYLSRSRRVILNEASKHTWSV